MVGPFTKGLTEINGSGIFSEIGQFELRPQPARLAVVYLTKQTISDHDSRSDVSTVLSNEEMADCLAIFGEWLAGVPHGFEDVHAQDLIERVALRLYTARP